MGDENDDVQAMLDAALDDLNDDDDDGDVREHDARNISPLNTPGTTDPPPVFGPPRPPPPNASNDEENELAEAERLLAGMMEELMSPSPSAKGASNASLSEEEQALNKLMQDMHSQLMMHSSDRSASSVGSATAEMATPEPKAQGRSSPETTATPGSVASAVDDTIASLLHGMEKHSKIDASELGEESDGIGGTQNSKPNGGESPEKSMLKNLMQDLGAGLQGDGDGDGDFDTDALIDGMMEQLVSKDLMYEPMKQVTEKFPDWLDKNRNTLSDAEYGKRAKQHDCFRSLVRVYETDPGNTTKLMELLQDVQEYGQPPAEIVHEIAPGLELDTDGMPVFGKAMGGGLPTDGECIVM